MTIGASEGIQNDLYLHKHKVCFICYIPEKNT